MSDEHPHVQLGSHSLPVYRQPFTRITKRLGRVMDAVRGAADPDTGEVDTAAFVLGLGDRVYETIETFIPNLPDRMPQYEFMGYPDRESYERGEEPPDQTHETKNRAPSFPELLDAFEAFIEVNGGKRLLDMLGKVFDPAMLRAEMSLMLSDWRERAGSTGSPSSPGPSTRSPQNGSTTTGPTGEPLAASQPLASGSPTLN